MKRRSARFDASGFTLIEAMISLFFIAFMVGEMSAVSMYAKRSSALARRLIEANLIAEGVLEKSRNVAYLNLNTQFSSLDISPDPIMFDTNRDGVVESYNETCAAVGLAAQCSSVVGTYGVTRTVTPLLPAGSTFATSYGAEVDVLVTWSDASGAKQVRVSTVRSKL